MLGQAVLGGLTVLYGLAPGWVIGHFLLSMALLVAAFALAWRATFEPGERPLATDRLTTWSVRALLVPGALTLSLGTIATAAGPHAGGEGTGDIVPRLRWRGAGTLDWAIHQHGALATLLGLSAVGVWFLLRARKADDQTRNAMTAVCVLLACQGFVGATQYALKLPAEIVWFHVVLAALTWLSLLWATAAAGRLRAARRADPGAGGRGHRAARPHGSAVGWLRGRTRRPSDELAALAASPTWMYEWDLGGGVRTATLGPELMSVHETRAAVMEPVVREALAVAGPGATALELACSEGWFAHRLLEWGAQRVVGIDIRGENIRRAELVRDNAGIDPARLSFQTADVFALDLEQLGTFDVVLCLGLIYHLENPIGALRVSRALTGRLCVVESQLTEQTEPIVHGNGETGKFLEQEASWAAWYESDADQDGNPIAAHGGVVSLIPNRAALLQAVGVAGFARVEALPVPGEFNPQYVEGHRLVVAGWLACGEAA